MTEASDADFSLLIRLSNGQRTQVTIPGEGGSAAESASISVLKVKQCIASKDSTAPCERQKLIFKGRILDNDRTLSDYGIEKGATLFMVKSAAPPSGSPPPSAPAAPTATPSTNSTGASAPQPSPMMGMGNPFANPFGGGMMGQQGPPNPEQMQAMLNSPQMQGLMDNPDLMSSMLQQSMQTPQMQELMRNNPELRQLYEDPAMIQQAIQMMRNPQHMQQVMRQQDLAMSQLENMPGGFAALSSMYRNVQEPMMEAQQASRRGDESTPSSRSSGGTEGATGAAMPNPWGSPAPAPRSSNAGGASGGMPNPWAGGGAGAGGMPNPWAGAGAGGGMPNPWGGAAGGGMPGMPPGIPGMPPGMPGMPPGMQPPNPDQMMQMLDNPMMAQMMENMVNSNPDMIRNMLEAQNPMMRQMFAGNPEQANNFIRQMMTPANLRMAMEMQRSMGGGGMPGAGGMPGFPPMMGGMPFGMPPAMPGANNSGGNNGLPGGGDLDFSNLIQQFQQSGIGGAAPFSGLPAQVPPSNPADRFRAQLRSLEGMGFDDEQANLAALTANHGNLNRAVDHLLSSPPPAAAPASAASRTDEGTSSGADNAEGAKDEGGDKKE